MSKLSELVSKGVRLIVVDPDAAPLPEEEAPAPPRAGRAPSPSPPPPPLPPSAAVGRARGRQLSSEVAEAEPPRRVSRSEVAADVQDFAAVYKEAGITLPPHGYGVDRIAEMLQGKRLAALGREVKATAVLAALEAARVDVQDVIEDGVRRDKALDAFEAAKERELVERKAANEARVQSLRKDLDELLHKINSEIEKLKQESQQSDAAFAQLQIRKRQEEARLHDVVAHFVEGANPITTGPGASGPADPARS
jgi:hypothetical protein